MSPKPTGKPDFVGGVSNPDRLGAVENRSHKNHLLAKTAALLAGLEQCAKQPDVEAVHRLRVTSRRIRVGLRMFSELFPDAERRQCCRQLRRLTRMLGAVRTLDVNIRVLRGAGRRLQSETREVQVLATRRLLAERAAAAKEVTEISAILRKSDFSGRLERMIRFTHKQWPSKRLLKIVREELERLRGVARRREKDWESKENRRSFHRLRIAVKKYRYALEVAQSLFGSSVKSRLDAVEELQDLMGASHDVEVLLDWFEQGEWEKSVSKPVAWITSRLREDHEDRRQEAVQFLKKNRLWMKKARLEFNDE
jgi:CHAD domain-containing protein